MSAREWALVAFTLLMQTSVGVLLVVTVLHPVVARGGPHASLRALELPLAVAAAVATLALVASLAHLGQPLHAWLAVANLRGSWLSREIALALLFTGGCVLVAVCTRGGLGSPGFRAALAVFTVVAGIAAVYAMSRLYMVPAQPAWNRTATPVAFFATALALGGLVVLAVGSPALPALSAVEGKATAYVPHVRGIGLVVITCLAAGLLLLPAQLTALAGEPAAAISRASAGHLATWLAAARVLLALAAAALVGIGLRSGGASLPAGLASAALLLGCVSEVCGRVLFYASSVSI